jgi:two-component system sensor histidine kinase BarA
MKYRRNLRSHLSLFSLLPGVLCALLVGGYLSYSLMRDIDNLEKSTGKAFSEQISHIAYEAMTLDNIAALQHIALITLENPFVRAVSFYDAQQQVISHAGPEHEMASGNEDAYFTNALQEILTTRNYQIVIPVTQPRLSAEFSFKNPANLSPPKSIGWIRLELSNDYLLLQKYKTFLLDVCIIGFILAATFWIATPFSDRLTRIIKEQTQGALEISRGNYAATLPDSGIAELRALSDAIHTLRRAMLEQQAGLQHSVEQSTKDLRDNMELIEIQNIELNLARRAAVQANRVKSEFLANTSHEIRTPLNSIIGFSKLLQKTSLSNQQIDYLQNIQQSSEGLLTIINDVLDLSKIEAGKLVLDHIGFDLYDTVEDILQILAPGAHEKGLELIHMIYSDVPRHLIGDSLRLKQILTNLISNAIKFSEKGRVAVRIAMTSLVQQHAIIKVDITDTGKGLPNNNTAIFNAFNQLDSSSTREHGGTGLGLAICKKLVEQMSGDIGYHSETANTTFWFTFRAEIATDHPETNNNILGNHNILICDPEPLCRLTLSHSLTRWGSHPIITESTDQIIHSIEHYAHTSEPIDVAIIGLPVNQTGGDIIKMQNILKRLRDTSDCKIILCAPTYSKYNFSSILGESIQHLAKPTTEKRLYAALLHALDLNDGSNFYQDPMQNQAATISGKTILAVDDNPSNLQLLSTVLRDLGATVLEATNGKEALTIFASEAIDLVFMDIQMPEMDGIETTQRIRQLQKNTSIKTPVIALTAHALAEQRQYLLQSGIDDYLSKPTTEQQLIRMIEKWHIRDTNNNTGTPNIMACVDIDNAMKNTGNRPELAGEMLSALLELLPSSKTNIKQAIADNDLDKAIHETHKLHGASCYCGTVLLKDACQALEIALKNGNQEVIIETATVVNQSIDAIETWRQNHNPLQYFHTNQPTACS